MFIIIIIIIIIIVIIITFGDMHCLTEIVLPLIQTLKTKIDSNIRHFRWKFES